MPAELLTTRISSYSYCCLHNAWEPMHGQWTQRNQKQKQNVPNVTRPRKRFWHLDSYKPTSHDGGLMRMAMKARSQGNGESSAGIFAHAADGEHTTQHICPDLTLWRCATRQHCGQLA